jgi:hypothetical protein
MYVNAKMIPVETGPEIGGGESKRVVDGVNSNTVCLIHCKNLSKCKCKCHNVPPLSTTIKENK